MFQSPIYKLSGTLDEFEEAELYLETSFSARGNTTNNYEKYTRDKSLGGTGIRPVRNLAFTRTVIASYSDCNTLDTVTDNASSLDTVADAFLTDYSSQFESVSSTVIQYRGIRNYNCDGINRQVRWTVRIRTGRSGGADTIVSQNSESLRGSLRWRDRIRLAQSEREKHGSKDELYSKVLIEKDGGSIR